MENPNDFIKKDTPGSTDHLYQRDHTEQYHPTDHREQYRPTDHREDFSQRDQREGFSQRDHIDPVHKPDAAEPRDTLHKPGIPPRREDPDRSWPSKSSVGWLIALLLIVAVVAVYLLTRPRTTEDPQALSTATPTAMGVQESTPEAVPSAPPVVTPTAAPIQTVPPAVSPIPTPIGQASHGSSPVSTPGTTAMASLPANTGASLPAAVSADDTWRLVLVNPRNPLPDPWEIKLTEVRHEQWVDERCYADLKRMLDDCRAASLEPLVCSSFRTTGRQEELFNNRLDRLKESGLSEQEASIETMKAVAVPGTSEHQTGLAVDIVDINNQNLDATQENTPVQQWLRANCHKYGFILRYPKDKTDITGVAWEGWHYRYVGPEHAAAITEQGLCLEEYLAGR